MLGNGKIHASARLTAAPVLLALVLALLAAGSAGASFGNPATISGEGVEASAPRIATDSQSNALAVWTERDGDVDRVRAAFRPAGGDVETIGFLSAPGELAYQPALVFDEHDNALVVWTQFIGPQDSALGRVQAAFRPAGGTFGPPQTISGAEPGVEYLEPQVDADESATVVWTRADATTQSVQAVFRPKDGTFGAPQTLSGNEGGYEPRVAIDERGNSLAVWTTDTAEVQSSFRPRTGDWSAASRVSAAGHKAFSPRIAVDGHNGALAVWAADGDGDGPAEDTFIQSAARPEGGAFGAPVTISGESGTAFDPQVAFDERDNALVAWVRSEGGSPARVETAFRPRNEAFGSPQVVSPASQDAFEPRIAVDESAVVVWSVFATNLRVQGAFRPKGGSFGGAQTLSEPGDSAFEPDVAIDERGNALTVWTSNVTTDFPVVHFSFRPRSGSFGEASGLSADDVGAFQAHVATDRLSNALAVWTVDPDVTDDSNPTYVEAAFAPAGAPFGPAQRLSDPSRNAYQPRVAFENDGDAVVIWTGEHTDGSERVHSRFRPAGNGFGPAQVLSPAGAFDPRVSAGHGTAVVWSRDDGAVVVAEAAVKPQDAGFLPAERISADGESANAPQVSVGKDGTAVATWYAAFGDHVAAAIGRTTAAGFAAPAVLSPPGMAASEPQAAVDERGNAIVVWTAGTGAFVQSAYRPRGAGFGPATDLAADGVFEPQVTFDESGNALAVWTRYVNEIGQIETALRPRGGVFGAAAVISATGEELTNFTPRIASDDAAAVVWTAQTLTGSLLRVQSAFRQKDGAFGPVQSLTDRLRSGYEPELAVDERGNVRAVWTLIDQFDAGAASAIQSAYRPRV